MHPDGSGAGQKPPGRIGTGCGNHTAAGYPFCQQQGPGDGLRPGAEVKEYFQVKLPGGCDFLAVLPEDPAPEYNNLAAVSMGKAAGSSGMCV